ncbi:MAG TPA: hypothetical protein DCM86_16160 [Verrucomicrobiales bacterium]|nr:hypothetical protein [Verrucomicrobiales bacterium]
MVLPKGSAPPPLPLPWFPDPLHAFVWRNWSLVPAASMARTVGARTSQIVEIGRSMGLRPPRAITPEQLSRSYITIIRRNWHLLPYDQLLTLLGWTGEKLAYTLREDDFLYVKLGNLKPASHPIRFSPPTPEASRRAAQIAAVLAEELPAAGDPQAGEPLFQFVRTLSKPLLPAPAVPLAGRTPAAGVRYCYSYFALYGDPLLEAAADPYPEGYLARLAASGVTGVWLQGVLSKLAPFAWDPSLSDRWQDRLQGLRRLVARAAHHGIKVYLYLNEPRSMPVAFYERHPELKGVVEGEHAALCSSHPEVQRHVVDSVATICRRVSGLGGFFTITASENLTNCWSHSGGMGCPRCRRRVPSEVIAEINRLVAEGIRRGIDPATPPDSRGRPTLFAWDWGWNDAWAPEVIKLLPPEASLLSVSEWSLPIVRGGVKGEVGEYSISSIGPGPRASRHWRVARDRGLRTLAKIQAGNTWELSAVPYIPAVHNVARHVANIRDAGIQGLMLGWTLGGYPSPNLEVATAIAADRNLTPEGAVSEVAERRFGPALGPVVAAAWETWSAAFGEFPYDGAVVYNAPLQSGPSNPLWETPTHYGATMVGIPYDDLNGWRGRYPVEVFIAQLEKVSSGFEAGIEKLRQSTTSLAATLSPSQRRALEEELSVAQAAAIHFQSVANQARFVRDRDTLAQARTPESRRPLLASLQATLRSELALARRLWSIQSADSRIGFEATNHYFYVPGDLAEKILNCRDLLDRWLPSQPA